MDLAIVIAVVVVALAFDYTNGFHDAANAIATSVSTRALTPRIALTLAAVMNFVGALLGQEVAKTVQGVLTIDGVSQNHGLVIVLAGLLGAISWNLITWYFGLPSSSSHALIGGLVGAGTGRRRDHRVANDPREGGHPDDRLAVVRLRARVPHHAGDHVDLPEPEPAPGLPRLPDDADALRGSPGAWATASRTPRRRWA